MDSSAPPSVAQLAGRFREQAAAAKEVSRAALRALFGRGLEEGEVWVRPRGGGAGRLGITKLGRGATEGSPECEECRHGWAWAGSLPAE